MVPAEPCRWVDHRGVRILVVAYGGCQTDKEMLTVLETQIAWIRAENRRVRVIHDYRQAFLGQEFLEQSKRLSKERRDLSIEKAAVVGLTKIQKALFLTYRVFSGDHTSQVFSDLESALDWLAPAPANDELSPPPRP